MIQMAIDFEPPSNGVRTSDAAAESVAGVSAEMRRRVLEHIRSCGDHGCTAEEIEDALGIPGNSVRPRLWELRKVPAKIKDSERTRPTRSGRKAVVYVVAP